MSEAEELKKEKRAVEEMLYQVLDAIGEPVPVSKEAMKQIRTADKQINIMDDGDFFVFSISEVPDGL